MVAKYGFTQNRCVACSQSTTNLNSAFDQVVTGWQQDPASYAMFTSESLGISSKPSQSYGTNYFPKLLCCGFGSMPVVHLRLQASGHFPYI